MAKLTAAKRKALPKSAFAYTTTTVNKKTGKKETKEHFPTHDKTHARAALALIRFAPASKKAAVKKAANMELYGTNNAERIKKIKARRAKKS